MKQHKKTVGKNKYHADRARRFRMQMQLQVTEPDIPDLVAREKIPTNFEANQISKISQQGNYAYAEVMFSHHFGGYKFIPKFESEEKKRPNAKKAHCDENRQ